LQLATGRHGAEADQTGALADIAKHPFGWVVVLVIAAGFVALALWQGWWALRARRAEGYKRVVASGKALVYVALALSAVSVALGRSKANSDQRTTDFTTRLMRHALGQVLVGAVGVAFCAGGLFLLWKAVRRAYDVELRLDTVPEHFRRPFEVLGSVGMVGRGVVVALVGYFLLEAAVTFDPAHAKGLDAALRAVVRAPYGPWLLGAVALALVCFGCFSLLEARFAKT
jgi:MFS family permease